MSKFKPSKLQVEYKQGAETTGPLIPRRYTLTHSDLTGDLFLVIGSNYDHRVLAGIYTRLMRDEVLAEWLSNKTLHVYCHVSGGLVFGRPGWRYKIFCHHLPMVLQAFRYGDRTLFQTFPELDQAPVKVHFRAAQKQYHKVEDWGHMHHYHILASENKS